MRTLIGGRTMLSVQGRQVEFAYGVGLSDVGYALNVVAVNKQSKPDMDALVNNEGMIMSVIIDKVGDRLLTLNKHARMN